MKSLHRIKVYQTIEWMNLNFIVIEEEFFNKWHICVVDTIATFDKDNRNYILEKLFTHFNFYELHKMKYPIKRSMSVGDIIELDGIKYQCMATGWKELEF